MTETLATAGLMIVYLMRGALMLCAAVGAGSWVPVHECRRAPRRACAFVLRAVVGMGLIGTAMTLLGLVGAWSAWFVAPGFLLLAVAGFSITARDSRRGSRVEAKPISILEWSLLAACATMGVNVLLGALAPDSQQDSLWYHLACARAWIEWNNLAAYPAVYPSNYSLMHSALYAGVLLVGDEIDCSLAYALAGFLCYTIAALFAWEYRGRSAAIWTWFLCASAHATIAWFAPINTGSDLFATMFTTAALLLAVDAAAWSGRPPDACGRQVTLSGLLAGFALATKVTALGYLLPGWLVVVAAALWRRRLPWPWAALAMAAVIAPWIPWCLRNITVGCGNPLFPLAREFLPVRDAFEVALRKPGHNSIFPPGWEGFLAALADLPRKFEFMAMGRSPAFLIHAAAIAGLFTNRPVLRLLGAVALLQWMAQFWVTGWNEVARYFAQCYPAIFVAAGWGLAAFMDWQKVSAFVRQGAAWTLAALLAATYAVKQYEWGAIENVGWTYRPVLRREAKLAYLETKPNDLGNVRLYDWINLNLPDGAIILMADIAHPFYVKRRYLWADEDLGYFQYLEDGGVADAAAVNRWLERTGVDYVVASPAHIAARPGWAAVLEEIPIPVRTPARLYSVREMSPASM